MELLISAHLPVPRPEPPTPPQPGPRARPSKPPGAPRRRAVLHKTRAGETRARCLPLSSPQSPPPTRPPSSPPPPRGRAPPLRSDRSNSRHTKRCTLDMDQHSRINNDEGATSGGIPGSCPLTTFLQPAAFESVPPPSSAGAAFLPVPASQGAVAYPATILSSFSNQRSSQANAFEAATNVGTPAALALTTYNHQPEALASVPPSSSAGATFLPAAGSQGGGAAYQASIPVPLSSQHQAAFQKLQQLQHHQLQYQQQQLQALWAGQLVEAEQATDLKVHNLPLARIKKIMKADEDVKMIAAEVPVVFAKACEMFILELTLRSWLHAEGTKRRTLQRSDVAAAIIANEFFDFLMDVSPTEEQNGDGVAPPQPQTTTMPATFPMHVPFPMYGNQQPLTFMWPPTEYQQQQRQQQNSDGGQAE
ncbi:hypothetical protein GQ55_6G064800 [Panicum hallii var. hallii]|uniref:Transcription factor CBF/NF-Y/archaeal histone domain-containing protein n=1 Tax=Panicum hallii var. hallii TaxID=1504633 RepID=A0A2T7D4J5_9POAL|nr:hypothetical protein GQ55_6G064800 [Panicum hallii var. hallii]